MQYAYELYTVSTPIPEYRICDIAAPGFYFLIGFLNELGNFKQKNFYISKCKISLHFTATDPMFYSLQ